MKIIYIILFSISLVVGYQFIKDQDFSEIVNKLSRYSNASKNQKKEILDEISRKDKKILIENFQKEENIKKLNNNKLIESLKRLPLNKEINCYSNDSKVHPACKPFINNGSSIDNLVNNKTKAYKALLDQSDKHLSFKDQELTILKIKEIKEKSPKTDFKEMIILSLKNNNKYLLDLLFASGYTKHNKFIFLGYETRSIYVISKVIQAGIDPSSLNKNKENIIYLSCKDNQKNIFMFLLTEIESYKDNNNYTKIERCLLENNWKEDPKLLKLLEKKAIPEKIKYFSGKKIIDPEKVKKDEDQLEKYNKQIELYNKEKEEKIQKHKDEVMREINDIIDM